MIRHNGRLWRAMEDASRSAGAADHLHPFMMSIPLDADLLQAENWTFSSRVAASAEWLNGKFGGWLEGNAVVTPEGKVVNILRVDFREGPEKAAIVHISDDGKRAHFDPQTDFIDFPGGCKKFTIRYDPISRSYWALANFVPPMHQGRNPERTRNTLALSRSEDLRTWQIQCVLLYHPDPEKHAFQYVDWLFEGNDILAVSRTAFDDGQGGAHNQHDANYLTFHRFKNFRQLTQKDSVTSGL